MESSNTSKNMPSSQSTRNLNKELQAAVHAKNIEEVKALLTAGADVNVKVEVINNQVVMGNTLLHESNTSLEITKELLMHGADVHATNSIDETPLDFAVRRSSELQIIKELLKHGADVNARNDYLRQTPLHCAIKHRRELQVVRELLEHGAEVNTRNKRSETPLHYAITYGAELQLVRELLERGAEVNARNDWSETPLHCATTGGTELQIVRELLERGAEVNARNKNSETTLHCVVKYGSNVLLVKEILKHGADVNARNMHGETLLHCAITGRRDPQIIREFLKHGADVNATVTSSKDSTPLIYAIKYGNPDAVRELLEYGADIGIREPRFLKELFTFLDFAESELEGIELLIKYSLIWNFDRDYLKIIDLHPYNELPSYQRLSRYLNDCVSEASRMKTNEIGDSLSLYEFVTSNINRFVRNNQVAARLANTDFPVHYPIYHDIILKKAKPFLERNMLLNKLGNFQFYAKFDNMLNQGVEGKQIVLGCDSSYIITEYLSNNDLLNLILAIDDANKYVNVTEPDTKLCEA